MSEKIKVTQNNMMPALAMRGLVVFPNIVMHFDVAREKSNEALKAALSTDRKIFLVTQKDISVDNPEKKDLYSVGVVSEIRQVLRTPDNVTRVLVEGLYKAKLVDIVSQDPYFIAEVKKLPAYAKAKIDEVEVTALMRSIKDIFEQYCYNMPKMPKELISSIMNQDDPYKLFENIVFNVAMQAEDKQQLLESPNIVSKLSLLVAMLSREVEILAIERQIQEQVREQIDKGQRDYYLREQLKAISSQLGEDDTLQDEAYNYIERIEALKLPEEVSSKLIKEAERLLKMSPASQEAFVIRNYLDTCLELPWNTSSKERADIKKAKAILDKDHYGLKKVKERILETIAVRELSPDIKGQIICLVGPPGVGKTSIGRSIAKSLGRKYARISLGGIKDESDIRGHRKTYIGSMPGRIITALKTAGTNNPLILLDEIDKMGNDFRGDPSSAMLEVLDSEQNVEFRDHYIEVPFDLSKVMFVTTANTTQTIDPPLLDRMEVIELNSYTREEKFHIAKEHLIPKQIKKNGLKASNVKITDDCIYELIDGYTKEAGVRNLEREVSSLCRKAAKEIVEENKKKVIFTAENIEKYLGPKKYLPDLLSDKNEVGIANGLAWTSVGGVLMPLEVLILDGKGSIELTGSLGEVMKESAKIAVSYVRSVADKYSINKDFYKEKDIHIHAPEGAVPKDGPSAGVTLVTSLVSALSGIPVRKDVAMTGEITLHGKVLPIGGLKEKTMAAYKAGIKTVIIPKLNKADLEEVDDTVKSSINFVCAENLSEVLDTALAFDKNENSKEMILSIPPDERQGIQIHS
ncbi:MAG: ATP-dependent proteinase [Oscillospiraceae bacterium]|jgi:ATP-dependent Lon protease|nr:ATP-dependent proteinase [Oscillospiraceae bacterium]